MAFTEGMYPTFLYMYGATRWPKVEGCSWTWRIPGVDMGEGENVDEAHMHSNYSLHEHKVKNNTWLSAGLSSYLLWRRDCIWRDRWKGLHVFWIIRWTTPTTDGIFNSPHNSSKILPTWKWAGKLQGADWVLNNPINKTIWTNLAAHVDEPQ